MNETVLSVYLSVIMASSEPESDPGRACDMISEMPRGNMLPLNSKRLTAALLRQLAAALDVPNSASAEDLRQLISGMLEEGRREPMNVQVIVQKSTEGTNLILRDVEGQFLEAKPQGEVTPVDRSGEESSGDEGETDVETLRETLWTMGQEKSTLQKEVSAVKFEL